MGKTNSDAKPAKLARTSRLPIRLSLDERAEWDAKASAAGSPSLTAYLRECVRHSNVVARPAPSTDRSRMLFLMNKASNNINQIAHQVNTANKSGVINSRTYEQLLAQLSALTEYMRAGVGHVD